MDRYYLDVAVDIPAVGDRRFTYSCPGSVKIPCGAKVHVLFGRSYTDAYVVGRSSQPKSFEVKDISGVYVPGFFPRRTC